ncbi:MAG: MerR family DNA-binding transcriptional regulator [bacterium]|nr:MerR family DNA-binding transcriptional regulator [bacterium]
MTKGIYFSIKEAANILGVSSLTLRNWDKSGKFPAQRHPMNNYRVYKLSALEHIIEDIEGGTNKSNTERRVRKLLIKHEE